MVPSAPLGQVLGDDLVRPLNNVSGHSMCGRGQNMWAGATTQQIVCAWVSWSRLVSNDYYRSSLVLAASVMNPLTCSDLAPSCSQNVMISKAAPQLGTAHWSAMLMTCLVLLESLCPHNTPTHIAHSLTHKTHMHPHSTFTHTQNTHASTQHIHSHTKHACFHTQLDSAAINGQYRWWEEAELRDLCTSVGLQVCVWVWPVHQQWLAEVCVCV